MYKSIMNKENASKLWKMIQEAGLYQFFITNVALLFHLNSLQINYF